MSLFEMVKQLEQLSAFQALCSETGDWDAFDKAEAKIKNIEKEILQKNRK